VCEAHVDKDTVREHDDRHDILGVEHDASPTQFE
jgi:hypothetical protein